MKFDRIVLQVHVRGLTRSDLWYDVVLWRLRPWCHFTSTSHSLLHMQ